MPSPSSLQKRYFSRPGSRLVNMLADVSSPVFLKADAMAWTGICEYSFSLPSDNMLLLTSSLIIWRSLDSVSRMMLFSCTVEVLIKGSDST